MLSATANLAEIRTLIVDTPSLPELSAILPNKTLEPKPLAVLGV